MEAKAIKIEAKSQDPIPPLETILLARQILLPDDISKLRKDIEMELNEAVDNAKARPFPRANTVEAEVYAS